ncbi:phenylalanine--tRNA ligase subunit alpha, partial [Acinetobacter baumannii]
MTETIEALAAKHLAAVAEAGTLDALEAVRLAALGKKGDISVRMKELGGLPPEERRAVA